MPTETIRIIVTESGAKQVASNIKGIGTEATSAQKALNLLEAAVLAVGSSVILAKYIELSSVYQQLQNRIRLVTNSTAEQAAVTQRLIAIANESFVKFEDTAELYARLAFNTRSLGLSQERLLVVTKAINQSIVLSGANAREASAAMIQLSQGLASGTLRGDELRSVLEQLPFAADVIGKELGVERDALKFLGAQGEVTSEQIVAAFEHAAKGIQDKFDQVVPSIRQALNVLGNEILGAVGEFDSSTGAAKELSSIILDIAKNVKSVKNAVDDVFGAISDVWPAIREGASAVSEVITGLFDTLFGSTKNRVQTTILFIAKVTDGLLGVVVGVIESVVVAAGFLPKVIGGIFVDIRNFVDSVIEGIGNFFIDQINNMIEGLNKLSQFVNGTNLLDPLSKLDHKKEQREVQSSFADLGRDAWAAFKGGFASATANEDFFNALFRRIEVGHRAPGGDTGPGVVGPGAPDPLLQNTVPGGTGGLHKQDIVFAELKKQFEAERDLLAIGQKRGQLDFDQQNASLKLTQQLKEKQASVTGDQRAELDALVQGNAERKIRNDLDASVADFNTGLKDSLTLLSLNSQEQERWNILRVIENESIKKIGKGLEFGEFTIMANKVALLQDRKNEESVINDLLGDRADIVAKLEAAQRLAAEGQITQLQLVRLETQARIDMRKGDVSMEAGFENGLDKLSLEITDFATLTEQSLVGAFHSGEDALIDFVTTGKFQLHDLITTIERDLARLLLRKAESALIDLVGSFIGGAASRQFTAGTGAPGAASVGEAGFFDTNNNFHGFRAGGGDVSAGSDYWVGEKGPELFRPSTNGTIIPNGASTQAAPHLTIINVLTREEMDAAIADPRNSDAIVNHIGRKRTASRQALQI